MAISFNFQGTNPVAGNLQMVETYKKLGVHHMLMAYNQKNAVGDGCHERTDGGLSRYGISLIQEMNRVGMVVDVSHTGYKTSMEAFETSCQPVIFSHANCRSLYDHERNITDEQIVACAKTGGVIGLTGVGLFMSKEGSDVAAGIIAGHIDHAVNLVGPDHVGLGLDYIMNTQAMLQEIAKNKDVFTDAKGSYDVPQLHFATPAVIPGVAETLLKKGYAEKDVRGILGENWIRVFESVIG
jgi:membrane dipeptidase